MKKYLLTVCAVLVGFALGVSPLGLGSPLTLFTGPAGTNPMQGIPATQPDFNSLINSINSAISPTGLFTASTFQVGGSTSVGSLTLGTVQPQTPTFPLGSITAKGFITFTDSQGKNAFIPFWE